MIVAAVYYWFRAVFRTIRDELRIIFDPQNLVFVFNGLFSHWIVFLMVVAMILGAFQFAEM